MEEDVTACLRNPDTYFDFGEVESLALEIEPKGEELNRIVKGLTQVIHEKQESRLVRQLDKDESRKTQSLRGDGPTGEGTNHSSKQEQVASSKQELLRTHSRKDGGTLVEPAVSGSMRKSELRSRKGSSNIVETANLFQEADQTSKLLSTITALIKAKIRFAGLSLKIIR